MDDDDQLLREMNRGQEAAQVLDHPLVVEFFEEAEKDLWQKFKQTPLRDAEGREKLHLMLFWLVKFQTVMQEHVMTGKLATAELQSRRTIAEQLKAAISSVNPWS